MTDKEKLQQLFNAALLDDSSLTKAPTRAFPESKVSQGYVPPAATSTKTVVAEENAEAHVAASSPAADGQVEALPNAGLDEATSNELGRLLDEQHARVSLRRRREWVTAVLVLVGLVGGGIGWFASSPARVSALGTALAEIRSVGDVKGMMGKYQGALDKIGTRGAEIEETSKAMGVDTAAVGNEDPYLEAETEAFTGEKGSGVGARNRQMQEKFGKIAKSPLVAGEKAGAESTSVHP